MITKPIVEPIIKPIVSYITQQYDKIWNPNDLKDPTAKEANKIPSSSTTQRTNQQDDLHLLRHIPYHGQNFCQSSPTSHNCPLDSMDTNASTSSLFPSRFKRTPSIRLQDGLGTFLQRPQHLDHGRRKEPGKATCYWSNP
jgi:hypothetical protein